MAFVDRPPIVRCAAERLRHFARARKIGIDHANQFDLWHARVYPRMYRTEITYTDDADTQAFVIFRMRQRHTATGNDLGCGFVPV